MNHDLQAGAEAADEERHAPVTGAAPDFLAGGGEAGALMRALDWAATPLGPPETWPQPLKTVTAIMLGSAQPMLVVWGRERIPLYNDGYAAMCGARHPRALGRPFDELWFDIWEEVEPILERAYAGRSTHMDDIQFTMHRHGYPEETHFAFSYTPVRGDDGSVAGMFCACTETTKTVLAERRRVADIERERRMFQRAPGFITILGGPDHVFEFANDSYVRLTGGRELVGKTAREALPEVAGQGFFELLDRVYASGERFVAEQTPIMLQSADGEMRERFLDFVYEPMLDEAGAVTGIFVEGHDVTESRRAEEAMRASEARYRQIVEGAEEFAIVTMDEQGTITGWNSGAERMLGWSEEEAIGRSGEIFFSDEDRAAGVPDHEMNRAQSDGRAVNERWHQRRDGSRFWGSGLMMRLETPGGGFLKIFRDRTAEHEADAALRASEARLQAFMQALPNHAWTAPANGMLDWFNDRVYEYSGAKPGELDGQGWTRLVHPDDLDEAGARWADSLATGNDYETEFRLRRADGAYRWHIARAVAIRGDDGAVARWIGTNTDIEEERAASEALRESEERFRNLADNAPVMVWVTEPDGACSYLSRSWYEFTGQSEAEGLGLGWLNAVHPDDAGWSGELFHAANARREPFQLEYRLRTADGGYRWAIDAAAPRFGAGGEFLGYVGSVVDIDDRKQTEEALRLRGEEFYTLADNIPILCWIAQPDGAITWYNSRWYDYTGTTPDSQQGWGWESVHEPATLPIVAERWQHSLETGTPFEMVFPLKAADGSFRPFLTRVVPIRNEAGEIVRWFGTNTDIADQRQAEQALREAAEELRTVLDAMPAAVWIARDPQAREIVGNRASYELLRIAPGGNQSLSAADEQRPTGFKVFQHGRELREEELPVQAAARGEQVEHFEEEIRFDDGEVISLYGNATPLRDAEGRPRGAVAAFVDVTGLKRAEAARRESEARFQAIANSIEQMVWSTRPDGFHDYYNRRWYEYTGMPDGSTDGDAWNGVFHPDDQERAWAEWRRCLETGEPYHIEYRLRHRSGQYRWVLGRAQPVRDRDGEITRWFGTCTDIQEIVEAREVLARSRGELERLVAERTEDRDRLWRNSLDLLLIARFDGRIVAVNPAWTTLLGWSEDELVGSSFVDLIHPDDLAASETEVEALASEKRSTMQFENRYRTKDGGWAWLSWAVTSEAGLFHGIARDISGEKARAAELMQAQEQLRQSQKLEAIGQLTGGVAHDFNNLLTVIRGSADLLKRQELSEERRRKYIEAISDTADRAARLTGQLLAFARRQSLKPEVFDAGERVRGICEMIATVVGPRVEIALELCGQCHVQADANQFETALLNLAVNARDAMAEEGRLALSVFEAPSPPGVEAKQCIAVRVSDTGRGIPAERIGQIFEPFFTTKEVGKGTGLGLSQVYGFAKQSGGDVQVESEPGKGAAFTLFLPRADEPAEAETERGGSGPAPEHRGCVLVVEDNEQVGEFSTELLRELGYETVWAADAEAALARLAEKPGRFDLVFSDVVMPGMSGLELGTEIKRRHPGLPVVLTSGYSHVLAQDGAHGFELLRKPYSLEDLAATLAQAMTAAG